VCAQPVARGDAPPVARDEAGEPVFGDRGDEVVADAALVLEELGGDDGTDGVAAEILRTGVAASIAVEPGDGVLTAGFELAAEHVACVHAPSIPRGVDRWKLAQGGRRQAPSTAPIFQLFSSISSYVYVIAPRRATSNEYDSASGT